MSNVLVSNPSAIGWPFGPAREEVGGIAVQQIGEERHAPAALRRSAAWHRSSRDELSTSKGPMPVWMMPSVPATPPATVTRPPSVMS